MTGALVTNYLATSSPEEEERLAKEFYSLPDLEQAVLSFIRAFTGRFHFVLSVTPDETRDLIVKHVPGLRPSRLQVVHPLVGTTGWATGEPHTALSSMVLINDAGSFNQICCRLRHPDAVYYVWAKFSCYNDINAGTIQAMSPHLFRRSHNDLHLYMRLNDLSGTLDLPSPATTKLLGVQNV